MTEFGLIGKKLGHSFSKSFFTDKFKAENVDASYQNFEMPAVNDPEQGLLSVIEAHKRLIGLNVTIPFKKDVIPFLDAIDPVAEEIGAVNTIKIDRGANGIFLSGFNTDIIGFVDTLLPSLTPKIPNKAVILGTGGASLAVVVGLHRLGFEIVRVSRTKSPGLMTYEELNSAPDIIESAGVIVNCTPVGMWPDVEGRPDLPYDVLHSNQLLYDLVYNPDPTEFMKAGLSHGTKVCSGRAMLEGQALASWRIWNNL